MVHRKSDMAAENMTEHKRNHAMGHTKGEIFRAYVNPYAGDTQSIYLGTPTKEALNKLSTHASLTCDPGTTTPDWNYALSFIISVGKVVPTELARNYPFPINFPLRSPTGLQCPECLSNVNYHSAVRQLSFVSKYNLKDHINLRLAKKGFKKVVICDYPGCKELVISKTHYYHHVVPVHAIQLSGA